MSSPDPWADEVRGRAPGPDDGAIVPPPPVGGDLPDPGEAPPVAARARKQKHRRPFSRIVAEYGALAVFAIVLAFFIRTFVGLAFYIPSESMVPALKVHDRVIVSRLSYHLHDPRRGDVVVFDNPEFVEESVSLPKRLLRSVLEVVGINQPKDKNLIKRIIGLPGETIEGRGGRVYIDGQPLEEAYLPDGLTTGDFAPETIEAGHYFMMGDNRGNSKDSRYIGTIRRKAIVGRAFVRIWPPWRIALL